MDMEIVRPAAVVGVVAAEGFIALEGAPPCTAADISPDDEWQEGADMKLLHHSYSTNGVRPSVPPLGTWKKKPGTTSIWIAEKGDSLRGLAKKVSKNEADWSCLWPVGKTKDHGYPGNIWPCDESGCTTESVARQFASRLLRKGAVSYGTDRVIGTALDANGVFRLFYNFDARTENFADNSEFYSAPVWKRFGGHL